LALSFSVKQPSPPPAASVKTPGALCGYHAGQAVCRCLPGTAKLVGTQFESLVSLMKALLDNDTIYLRMANTINPYGDGNTSKLIVDILMRKLQ
jgi:UDP-N-acetylglucosamine 2-epimerase